MSNNRSVRKCQGLTISVVGQVTDVTYRGVKVMDSSNGQLGQMINQVNQRSEIASASAATTKSEVVKTIPLNEMKTDPLVGTVALTRAYLIGMYSDVNMKVRDFHQRLNDIKNSILGQNDQVGLNTSDLMRIQQAMQPYQVGKVVKIKLQARIYSDDQLPSLRAVAGGGYANTRVLYTFYVEHGGRDIQEIVSEIADAFRSQITDGVEVKRYQVTARRREDEQVIFVPNTATVTVPVTENGQTVQKSVEAIRGFGSMKRTNLFGSKKR